MPKQIRFIATTVVAMVLALAGLFQPPASSTQQSPQASTTSARNAALIAATSDVLKETSEIRQLPVLRAVQSSIQSRPEIERMLMVNLDEETTPVQMGAAEGAVKRQDRGPAEFQYRALLVA